MRVCIYVYIYIYIHMCVCIYIDIYTCIYMYTMCLFRKLGGTTCLTSKAASFVYACFVVSRITIICKHIRTV